MPNPQLASPKSSDDALDPMFVHARRELRASLLVFLLFGVWVLAVSWLLGKPHETGSIGITLGMPTWAFWGVAVPWIAANVFIFWFCFSFMDDDPLEQVANETDQPTSP